MFSSFLSSFFNDVILKINQTDHHVLFPIHFSAVQCIESVSLYLNKH